MTLQYFIFPEHLQDNEKNILKLKDIFLYLAIISLNMLFLPSTALLHLQLYNGAGRHVVIRQCICIFEEQALEKTHFMNHLCLVNLTPKKNFHH